MFASAEPWGQVNYTERAVSESPFAAGRSAKTLTETRLPADVRYANETTETIRRRLVMLREVDGRLLGLDSREPRTQLAKWTEHESCLAQSRRMTHSSLDGRSHAFSDQQSSV